MPRTSLSVALGLLLLLPAFAGASGGNPPYATPAFYSFSQPDGQYSDYRPVLNADGTAVIFERSLGSGPVELYIANLMTSPIQVQKLFGMEGTRPDWCWDRSNGKMLTSGPVAFSNDNGIYVAAGTNPAAVISPSLWPVAARAARGDPSLGGHVASRGAHDDRCQAIGRPFVGREPRQRAAIHRRERPFDRLAAAAQGRVTAAAQRNAAPAVQRGWGQWDDAPSERSEKTRIE